MSDIGQQLIRLVRAKAAENPDFRYQPPGGRYYSCVYVHKSQPSCLIGHALWGAGLINAEFEHRGVDSQFLRKPNQDGFDAVQKVLGLELDREERAWLEQVQAEQDNEKPWGSAVQAADDYIKDMDE